MKKGFALDDERLKEILERIRDIHASEKVFYRQVLEIYATSIDYDPKAEISIQLFKMFRIRYTMRFMDKLQQKLFILAEKEFMGLMAIAGNQPTLKEAVIAKNYLNEKSFGQWDNLFTWYLDFAERQAEREQVMTMSIGQSIWIVSIQ